MAAKHEIAKQTLSLETNTNLKAVLVDDSYTFDQLEDFVDAGDAGDVASHEIGVSGYTGGFGGSGRKALPNVSTSRDDANLRIEFDADNLVWSALGTGVTIGGVVVIEERTNDADSLVVAFDDLVNNVPTNGSDVTYQPDSEGIVQW